MSLPIPHKVRPRNQVKIYGENRIKLFIQDCSSMPDIKSYEHIIHQYQEPYLLVTYFDPKDLDPWRP